MTLLLFLAAEVMGQRQAEYLNRGLISVRVSNGNFVAWRMLGSDPADVGFNVYQGSTKLNSSPITNATSYLHSGGASGASYTVRAVAGGSEQGSSEASLNLSQNYLDVPISPPSSIYSANDASVGDLNGDGQYEIVLKWDPSDAKDNSQSGVTSNVFIDAYTLSGTRMWRIDLGRNIRAGAHYTQFQVYDLDGNGKAEMVCKTADGTKDGQGNIIGSSSADYRNSSGYILSGPEFLTVFDGQTGRAIHTVDYLPPRGTVSSWGDDYGNRVDRFLACTAYLSGSKPSVVMCRGYYTRTVLVAWDFNGSQLTRRWTFDSNNGYSSYAGQGNHNLSVHDVDGDGRDEIIYGSCCIDDNGTGLWTTGLGHGDALHVCDINPSRSGLEVWGIHEGDGTPGSALLDARTGSVIWKTANADVGRGVSADLTSAAGMECWGGTSDLRTAANGSAGSTPSSANHLIWWDGDRYRELLDGTSITKYGGSTLLSGSSCASINGTKSNPCLSLDLFGDWREEVIWRTSNNTALRIYTTTISTNYRFYTLMHDPAYRLAIAWQNTAYNQPPHPSYFLGEGMGTAPRPSIYYPAGSPTNPPTTGPTATRTATATAGPTAGCTPTAITPHVQIDGGTWNQTSSVSVNAGQTVMFGPQPTTGGSWSWSGPNGFSAATREVTISNIQANQAGNYTATHTNDCGSRSTAVFTINVGGSTGTNGDVNSDGSITIVDALMVAQYSVGLNPSGFTSSRADVNCDGSITIVDALIIAQRYVGLISSFPC